MRKFLAIAAGVSMLAFCGAAPAPVQVVYAGSLVTPMERAVGPAFSRDCACPFQGEGKGSVALAKMIEGGVRNPDVFISADSRLMDELLHPGTGKPFISKYVIFGAAQLVLGYSPRSAFGAKFRSVGAGKTAVAALLKEPGLRLGRTDPKLDPKGIRTVHALRGLGLSADLGEIFPEEDLLVRLESGDLDAAFLYSTESKSRNVPAVNLPAAATRDPIRYSFAILDSAANPQGAQKFENFLLTGPGKAILEAAGVTYVDPNVEHRK
ncbi:MAG: substrate-binding domain-containing protein [Candidatus Eremiobacteraeota bacterium]|nr:substrate-binding domain-containing protein [Candidatus Eremiobacteraeota bacterium]